MSSYIGVKYGDFFMQDPTNGYTVISTNVWNAPTNRIQADELAEADGAKVVQQRYTSKTFTVEGRIQKTTRAELDAALDTFKLAMAQHSSPFDIDHGNSVRRYLASSQNVVLARVGETDATYSVEFFSPDGMGWDAESSTLIASTNIGVSTLDIAFTVGGTYVAEPIIELTVNTITGGTAKTISLSNSLTLRGMQVTRDWVAGDVLEVDCLKKSVYVNNIVTDFSGQIPSFEPGNGGVQYIDDFTARDVTITASYTKRWL